MSKITYNKLVRDRIPEIIESDNKKCNYHYAKEEDHIKLLKNKVQEEVLELLDAKTREEVIEEVADLLEVLTAYAAKYNWTENDIYIKRLNKYLNKGDFSRFIILESVEDKE